MNPERPPHMAQFNQQNEILAPLARVVGWRRKLHNRLPELKRFFESKIGYMIHFAGEHDCAIAREG